MGRIPIVATALERLRKFGLTGPARCTLLAQAFGQASGPNELALAVDVLLRVQDRMPAAGWTKGEIVGMPIGREAGPGLTVFGPDTAPPLVLVHGIRLSATMWRPHVRRLAPDFRVGTPDLPGHGALSGSPFTLNAAVEAVHRAVLEAREVTGRRPLLLGLSLGGYVSLAHTARYGDHTAALVLYGCTARTTGPLPLLYVAVGRVLDRLGPDRAAALDSCGLQRVLPPESAEAVLAGGLATHSFGPVVAELRRSELLDLAPRLGTPTIVLNGRADLPFRTGERRFLAAARRSGAPVRLFHTRGGHLLSLTEPDRFAALVRRAHRELLGGV